MYRNTLKRHARADELRRIENAARTVEDFDDVVDMYDKLDANRERRERYNELSQNEYTVQYAGSKQKGYKLTFTETEQKNETSDEAQEDKPNNADKKDKKYQKKESKVQTYDEGAIIPTPICHPYL